MEHHQEFNAQASINKFLKGNLKDQLTRKKPASDITDPRCYERFTNLISGLLFFEIGYLKHINYIFRPI